METRLHFIWKPTGGSLVQLNGTQIVVKFALASVNILGQVYTGILPTVFTQGLIVGLLGSNSSVSFPYQQIQTGLFSTQNWIYPLTNGGPHGVQLTQDANSPPGGGPNAYEPGAGPADPFYLYGTGRNYLVGGLVGIGVTIGVFLILVGGRIETRALSKWLRRRR